MVSIKPHRHELANISDLLRCTGRYSCWRLPLSATLPWSSAFSTTIRIPSASPLTNANFPKQNPRTGGIIYMFGFGITKSPHMIAHQFGHTAVFDLLMQRSAPWLRLVQAVEVGDEPMTQRILQQHPTIFTRLSSNAARRIVGVAVRNNTQALELPARLWLAVQRGPRKWSNRPTLRCLARQPRDGASATKPQRSHQRFRSRTQRQSSWLGTAWLSA